MNNTEQPFAIPVFCENTNMHAVRLIFAATLCALLVGCGGHGAWGGKDDDDNPAEAPSAPLSLTANAGDQAISLGWDAPTTNNSDSITYAITISPTASAAVVTIRGTTALIRGLRNDTTYTLSVTASNNAGTSPVASVQSKPAAALVARYTRVAFANNPVPTNGFAEPALLRAASGKIWMAYTDIEANGSGQILRSAVRVAHSDNNGTSYLYDQEVGRPKVTVSLNPNGEWHYRTPTLIEDSSDPDANRRFKLFAHKYFFNPLNNNFSYEIGAIAMWTAAAPDGNWSAEQTALGWASTPTSLQPFQQVSQFDTSLQTCLWVDEGGAAVGSNGIDLVFSCAIDNSPFAIQRKIVLLRSANHAQTFTYVATLLQPADAVAFEADSFSMPSLLPGAGTAPVLLASPIDLDGNALGCVVFPIADAKAGKLFTTDSAVLTLQTLPPLGDSSGGCTWDRSIPAGGILMSNRGGSTYTIQSTGKSL